MTTIQDPGPGPDSPPRPGAPAAEARLAEALACLESGLHGEAIQLCKQVMAELPECPEALHVLALTAYELDDPMGAIRLLEHAHAADPGFQEYAEALAAIYVRLGKVSDGLFYAKLASTLAPHPSIRGLLPESLGSFFTNFSRSHPFYYRDRSALSLRRGAFNDAAADAQRQLEIDPGDPGSLRILARARRALGQFESALAASHALLHQGPPGAADLALTADILAGAGRYDEARACHEVAGRLAPDEADLASRRLADLAREPGMDRARLDAAHRAWAGKHAASTGPAPKKRNKKGKAKPSGAASDPEPPLRVGYFCAAFHEGDLMTLVEPILRHHEQAGIEVFCYAEGDRRDATTESLMGRARRWTCTTGIDDLTLARILRGDGIDVAVDLTGHGEGGRPRLFALGPAPATLTWLGYGHPLGVAQPHRFLSDPVAWPDETAASALEALRLPHACFALERPGLLPEVEAPPALAAGHATFGLSCDLGRVGPEQAAQWSAPLQAVEGARLLICNRFDQDDAAIRRCLDLFTHLGLRQRVDIVNMAENFTSPFEFYRHVDVALDPGYAEALAENGRALWMGVPLLTVAGDRHATRLGASLLHHAGRDAWVARDAGHLGEIAADLVANPDALAGLRTSLRGELAASPVADVAGFARALEEGYRRLLSEAGTSGRHGSRSVKTRGA
ncbi:MAG: hypothetical protein QNJ67_03465 [Kiloniellales bacterium]|nr:hypothetical protein [Kiloniellales bacterium]